MHITLKYPVAWADKVVQAFHDSYARATELVCDQSGVSLKEVAWCLAKGSTSWENFKKLVQVCDRYIQRQLFLGQIVDESAIWAAVWSYGARHGMTKTRSILTPPRKGD